MAKPVWRGIALAALPLSLVLMAAGDPAWKSRPVAEWTEEDAREVLTDSPWAKTVTATLEPDSGGERRGGMGGGGNGGGIRIGGISLPIPGTGGRSGGRIPGSGSPGSGNDPVPNYPGGGRGAEAPEAEEPPKLQLRWESALPVRQAEMKAKEANAPDVDVDHFAIAVYGVPRRMANGDSTKSLAGQLKKAATLERASGKPLKPSEVNILWRDKGPVIVYLFPRAKGVSSEDKSLEFRARVGRLSFAGDFDPAEMVFQGKTEF